MRPKRSGREEFGAAGRYQDRKPGAGSGSRAAHADLKAPGFGNGQSRGREGSVPEGSEPAIVGCPFMGIGEPIFCSASATVAQMPPDSFRRFFTLRLDTTPSEKVDATGFIPVEPHFPPKQAHKGNLAS